MWRDDVKNWIIEYIGVKKRPELYQGVLAGISVVPHQFPSGKKRGSPPNVGEKRKDKDTCAWRTDIFVLVVILSYPCKMSREKLRFYGWSLPSHHSTWSRAKLRGTSMIRWLELPRKRRLKSFSFKWNSPSTSTSIKLSISRVTAQSPS